MNFTRGKGAVWVARREIDHRARSTAANPHLRFCAPRRRPPAPAPVAASLALNPQHPLLYLSYPLVVLRIGVLFCSAILGEERLPFCSGVLGSTADHLQR